MEYFEIVHLRSYSQSHSNDAIEAFHQLTFTDKEKGFEDITISRDIILDNDLCICIRWHSGTPERGKSPLGLQSAAAFSGFGKINHSTWVKETRVPIEIRRNDYEEQK